jgi:predicted metal-dependent hydrolase
MASYKDTVPTFNPYVKQLPLEAMVQVGMYKQQKYEEGIQKIQTSIDNVAGLDVANDADKAYLQSKLNQLGNDLTTVAAGDFSNFQLVNSTTGMVSQIARDPNVQTAASSTAWLRKQQADMEKAIAEGKSSQSNIYDFNQQASEYLNNDKVGQSFRGRYTQYTDVKKKALDTIKALNPDLLKYDIPFVDENGRIDQNRIADAMKRYKIEGISAEKITQALSAAMTPDDLNQLRIDAKYQFRGVGPEQLAVKAKQDYDIQRREAIGELDRLQVQQAITTDPTKLDDIENQIEQYKELLGGDGKMGKLDERFYKNVEQARTNPDEVKYNIYKDGFVSEYANAFKYKKQEMEYVENPLMKRQQWIAEMKLKQETENRQRYEFGVTTDLTRQKIAIDAEKLAIDKAMAYGVEAPWTDLGNPTDNLNRGSELFTNHVVSVQDSVDSTKGALKSKGYREADINEMVKKWNDAQGVVSKANIPANAIKEIQDIVKNENYLKQLETFETKTRADSEKEAGVSEIINSSVKGRGNVSFSMANGERVTLTPKELVGVLNAERKQTVPSGEGTAEQTYIDPKAALNKNQRKYVDAVYGFGGKLSNTTRTQLNNIVKTFRPAVSKVKEAYDKADTIYTSKLGESAFAFVPKIKAVSNPKGEVPPIILQKLNQLVIAQNEKGIKTDGKWDFGTASSYLTDKLAKDTRVIIKQDGDNYTIQLRNLQEPDNVQSFKVNSQQVRAYLGDEYVNDNSQVSGRFTLGKGNSDINRSNIATDQLMQKRFGDFPGIKKLQVTAKLEEDTPGLFIPTIFLKQKDGKYVRFEIAGDDKLSRVGYEQGIQNLNSLNDKVLMNVLKQAYPTYDFDSKIDYP